MILSSRSSRRSSCSCSSTTCCALHSAHITCSMQQCFVCCIVSDTLEGHWVTDGHCLQIEFRDTGHTDGRHQVHWAVCTGMTGESGEQTGMGRTWMTLTGGGTCLMSRNWRTLARSTEAHIEINHNTVFGCRKLHFWTLGFALCFVWSEYKFAFLGQLGSSC